jgi:hypothetical protein
MIDPAEVDAFPAIKVFVRLERRLPGTSRRGRWVESQIIADYPVV